MFLPILIFASFIESTTTHLHLSAVLLLARLLTADEKYILIRSFFIGLILSLLLSVNLSFYAIYFLFLTKLTRVFKYSPLSANIFTSVIFTALVLSSLSFFELIFLKISISLIQLFLEIVLFIFVYMTLLFFARHFSIKKEIKLKVQ